MVDPAGAASKAALTADWSLAIPSPAAPWSLTLIVAPEQTVTHKATIDDTRSIHRLTSRVIRAHLELTTERMGILGMGILPPRYGGFAALLTPARRLTRSKFQCLRIPASSHVTTNAAGRV